MAPVEMHSHAIENLRFIRDTMERASSFTAVPGRGGMAMGATALLASWIAAQQPSTDAWLAVWLMEMVVALAIGTAATIQKARRTEASLAAAPARKFALAFAPPLVAGALLTVALWRMGVTQIMPGLWLCLYGVAVAGAGVFSVRIVPAMGGAFLAFGAVALFVPADWANICLAGGFGGLHLIFGFIIARRYGG